ncbi:hypothetical protein BH20ACT6_BH20ACT6_05710 [soil metagenome]
MSEQAGDGPPADPEQVARQILLRRLTDQPRSRAELASTLAAKGVPDEVASRVLDRYEEVGLVDDRAFATAWVGSRHRGRGLGRRALARELRRKGIDDDVARKALAEVCDYDEEAAAAELVRRKLPAMRRLDPVRAQRRLLGMLARKGYGADVAVPAVRAALAGRCDASADDEVSADGQLPDASLDQL